MQGGFHSLCMETRLRERATFWIPVCSFDNILATMKLCTSCCSGCFTFPSRCLRAQIIIENFCMHAEAPLDGHGAHTCMQIYSSYILISCSSISTYTVLDIDISSTSHQNFHCMCMASTSNHHYSGPPPQLYSDIIGRK